MRVALTGTPGTGKTSAASRAAVDLEVIHLGEVVDREGFSSGTDPVRESTVVDMHRVAGYLEGRDDILFESHYAHRFEADRVIVLRCAPALLEERLRRQGFSERSVRENAESEAIDLILSEAVERHGRSAVFEVETTDRAIDEVADAVDAIVRGERDPTVGTVDYTDYL